MNSSVQLPVYELLQKQYPEDSYKPIVYVTAEKPCCYTKKATPSEQTGSRTWWCQVPSPCYYFFITTLFHLHTLRRYYLHSMTERRCSSAHSIVK